MARAHAFGSYCSCRTMGVVFQPRVASCFRIGQPSLSTNWAFARLEAGDNCSGLLRQSDANHLLVFVSQQGSPPSKPGQETRPAKSRSPFKSTTNREMNCHKWST